MAVDPVVAWLLVLLLCWIVGYRLVWAVNQIVFRLRSNPVPGRIVWFVHSTGQIFLPLGPVDVPVEFPVVEYPLPDGRLNRALTRSCVEPFQLPIGTGVVVWYRPGDVSRICVDGVDPGMRALTVWVLTEPFRATLC